MFNGCTEGGDTLKQIVHDVILKENEDNWELKEKSLLKLKTVAVDVENRSQLVAAFKNFHFIEGYAKMVTSLRTQLAITACQTLVAIVQQLQAEFEPFGEYLVNVLIKACGQTKKIVANSAAQTIKSMIFDVPSVKYLQLFFNMLSDKNPVQRARGAEFFRDLVPKVNFKAHSKGPAIELFENCLRKTLGDGNAIVRAFGHEVLDMYQLIWPGKVSSFIESLDYLTKKQLLKRNEKVGHGSKQKVSPTKAQTEGTGMIMHDEPSCMLSPSKMIQSPRKSLYEDFLENEHKRCESRSILEKSVEFLKQNQVELRVFHILGLKELEEIALQESPKYLPMQAVYDEEQDPINVLKNIIVRSKDDALWNRKEFDRNLQLIFDYAYRYNRQNALYAFFVLLSNQGSHYMAKADILAWLHLMQLLADKNAVDIEEVKCIEDEIIVLLATHLPFESVCLLFKQCCDQNLNPSFAPPPPNHPAASVMGLLSSKYVENHFDLLHHSLMACTKTKDIHECMDWLHESLYQSFLCSKTKLLANKIFVELYRKIGGDRLFAVFCTFSRPQKQLLKTSCELKT